MLTRFLCDHVEDASPELLGVCGRNSLFIDQTDLEARFDAEVVADGGYNPDTTSCPATTTTRWCGLSELRLFWMAIGS